MFDKRVHRGNSYAAMVIPAGTSHDTMIMEKRQTQKAQSLRNRSFKSVSQHSLPKQASINENNSVSQHASFQSTQTETRQRRSLFMAVYTLLSRLMSILKTLPISHRLKKWELQLSSTSTDLLCRFSSQKCQQKKTARQRRFSTRMQSFLTLTLKSNRCLMFFVWKL